MKDIQITDAELEIMKILWGEPAGLTSGDIRQRLDKAWERTTVLTLLSRLDDKGAISTDRKNRSHHYKPLVKKEDYGLSQTRSILRNLYNGSVKSMVAALCTGGDLTEEDIGELQEILEKIDSYERLVPADHRVIPGGRRYGPGRLPPEHTGKKQPETEGGLSCLNL